MRNAVIGLLFLALTTGSAFAQEACTNKIQGFSPTAIQVVICDAANVPTGANEQDPEKKPTITIEAGGGQFQAKVTQFTPRGGDFDFDQFTAAVVEPGKAQENLLLLSGIDTATLKYDDKSVPVDVVPADPNTAKNFAYYKWNIGPASKGDDDGESDEGDENIVTAFGPPAADPETDDASTTGAIRFQYNGEYGRGGLFGKKRSLLQTTAALSIDTTDQDSADFIDNNRVSLGVNLTNLSLGRLWMHGKVGLEGRLEKAFHRDIHNGDAVIKVSGWIPVLRSYTLFSKNGEFIAPPLSFSASWGYRDRDQEGQSARGRVFEASALYHLFLFDQYEVDLSGTLTVNDLDNRQANVPRTQRLYKATISYLASPEKGFKVMTSIENGSAGVMLKEVRQYFVGIALSKLNLAGQGGN